MNESKQDKNLKEWASINNIQNDILYVDFNTSFDINDFEMFIKNRKAKLKEKIKSLIS